MSYLSKFQKISVIGVVAAISTIFYYNSEKLPFEVSYKKRISLSNSITMWDYNWDRRDPKSTLTITKDMAKLNKGIKKKGIQHVILVRHGQYNTRGSTDDEKKLTTLGKIQAEATGMRLAEISVRYTMIVRSTMTRAQETSKIIESFLPTIPVFDDCLLVEGYPISPDPPSGHWKSEKVFFQDGPRIEAAFRKYIHRPESTTENDTYIILVCHANVIRYFLCRALQIPAEAWLRMSLNHGSMTWISILPSGRVILRCFGETGHMMPDWITSS